MDPSGIEQYLGTYRGVSPTDESPIGLGEIEIIIEKDRINVRMATGVTLATESYRTEFTPVPKEELESLLLGSSTDHSDPLVADASLLDQTVAFRDDRGFVYWFGSEGGDVGVCRMGGLGDLLGPTALVRDLSGARYEEFIRPLEAQGMPLLRYEGRTSLDTHK